MATSTRPGDLLAGRYRLIDLLAESGGGRFWRAQDSMLERFVALHVLSEDDPRAPELLAAARASAGVHDPRVLRVLDASTADGLTYVVNEWGTGTSLDILLTGGGPLGPRRSSWLVSQVAAAIATAHRAEVTHGRLNPENVLVDRFGAIRVIGLGVDAALHGLPRGRRTTDQEDLAGLLYCCLTGTWPGPSPSQLPQAHRDHGLVLPPRRVRHGIPKQLDDIWRDAVDSPHRRRHPAGTEIDSVAALRDRLREFIGDPAGLPQALAASIPAINELKPVDLPAVSDPLPHDHDRPRSSAPTEPAPEPEPEPTEETTAADRATDDADEAGEAGDTDATAEQDEAVPASAADEPTAETDLDDEADDDTGETDRLPAGVSISDLPTEAGMPVFDDGGDVEWFRAGRTEPPPPPPLADPPERPLFAPEPEAGEPVRRPREGAALPPRATLPREQTGPAPPPPTNPWEADLVSTAEQPAVPGRSWLRLGLAIAAALLLLVAIVVAFNLGRGRTPLGGDRDDEPATSAAPAEVLSVADVDDFDPFGSDGGEHPEQVDRVIDGDPATTWTTDGYLQQFGPGGLKPGVGLVLDLDTSREITEVVVTVTDSPTTAELHLLDAPPTEGPTGTPVATATASDSSLTLTPESDATGRYLLIWFTELAEVTGTYPFRSEVAEVVVRGR